MPTPMVSVVIPCKGRQAQLHRALASVSAQTVRPAEVVVVDDGSEPPLAVADGFAVPVRLVRQTNRGPSAARNRGVREAAGDWIALLDSDDTWMPDKLEVQLRLLARHPEAGFCVADMQTRGRPPIAFPLTPPGGEAEGLVPDALERLLARRYIHTSGVMFRKAVFTAVGGFDEALWYCEDRDLWLRLAAATRVAATSRRLTVFYREDGNLSDWETTPRERETDVYILTKVLANPLFGRPVRAQAAALLGLVLYELGYCYRKHGKPWACCLASLRSLTRGGPAGANLKNLLYCWPEALAGVFRRPLPLPAAPATTPRLTPIRK